MNHLQGDYISIYVPTTPNPTGGYFVMVPTSAVVELDMTVDEALKYHHSPWVSFPPVAAGGPCRLGTPRTRGRPASPAQVVNR